MAKSVTLKTGLAFKTVADGLEHFSNLLNRQEPNVPFAEPDEADIRAVYEAYCDKTDWVLASPASTFHSTQERGPGYTTRCYGVTFEDGTTGSFSMEKALRAVAI